MKLSIVQKFAMATVVLLATFTCMIMYPEFLRNWVAVVIGIELGIAYIPQIIQIIKTKSSKGLSLDFIIILNVALLTTLMNSLYVFSTTGVWGYLFIEIINEGLALFVLGLMLYYRD